MASEQAIANEGIAKAVAEVTTVAIQAIPAAASERPQNAVGPKIGRPAMKQQSLNWETDDKYRKLKNSSLEVNYIITSYNTPHTEQLAIVKMASQERPVIHRIINTHGKRKMQHNRRLIQILTNKFRPQFNKMIKSLQFHKLSRQSGEMQRNRWSG